MQRLKEPKTTDEVVLRNRNSESRDIAFDRYQFYGKLILRFLTYNCNESSGVIKNVVKWRFVLNSLYSFFF